MLPHLTPSAHTLKLQILAVAGTNINTHLASSITDKLENSTWRGLQWLVL